MILLFAIGVGILIHCGVAEIMFIAERLPLQVRVPLIFYSLTVKGRWPSLCCIRLTGKMCALISGTQFGQVGCVL